MVITSWTIRISILLLGLQILISHVVLPYVSRSDFFPFYTWNIYSFTPNRGPVFAVRILEVDSKPSPIAEPHSVLEHPDVFPSFRPSSLGFQVYALGQALLRSDSEQVQRARTELEYNLFMNYDNVKYEVLYLMTERRDFVLHKDWGRLHSLEVFDYKKKAME